MQFFDSHGSINRTVARTLLTANPCRASVERFIPLVRDDSIRTRRDARGYRSLPNVSLMSYVPRGLARYISYRHIISRAAEISYIPRTIGDS
jgi:hypothetical protein